MKLFNWFFGDYFPHIFAFVVYAGFAYMVYLDRSCLFGIFVPLFNTAFYLDALETQRKRKQNGRR